MIARLAGLGVLAVPLSAAAAVAPRGWGFPGAGLLIGAGCAIALVLLGRSLAGVARRAQGGRTRG